MLRTFSAPLGKYSAPARLVLFGAFWFVAVLVLFRPWDAHPLPIRDFGGIIALLANVEAANDAHRELMRTYALEGRFQPVFMATLAAQWAAFRLASDKWQVTRFFLMVVVTVLVVLCAQRFGASWIASIGAAGLWLVLAGGRESWYLLQIAEPVAALFVFTAILCASYWQAVRQRTVFSAVIACLLVCAIWAKETMVAAVPCVWAVAVFLRNGAWSRPAISRELIAFSLILFAGMSIALVPILEVRDAAAATAYASRFDLSSMPPQRVARTLSGFVLPVTRELWFPANIVFLVLLISGWCIRIRQLGWDTMRSAGVLMLFPICGIVVHSAWPSFPGYYAMPFLISLAILFALALSALGHLKPRTRLFTAVGFAIITAYGLTLTWNDAETDRVSRRVDSAAVTMLSRVSGSRALLVGVPDPVTSGGVAGSLLLYARALSPSVAPRVARDVTCADAMSSAESDSSIAVVLFSHLCDSLSNHGSPAADTSIRFRIVNWKTFAPKWETMRVSLWLPS